MRVLLIGQTSFLGKKCAKILAREHEVFGTYHTRPHKDLYHLDITDQREVNQLTKELQPDIIILAAALVPPDVVEKSKQEAIQINIVGTKNVAIAARRHEAKLIFISSNSIFPGSSKVYTEDSNPMPVNHYGWTKLEGERIIHEQLANYAIIRPTVLHGYNDDQDSSFFMKVVKACETGASLELNNVYIKFPVLIDDIARDIADIINRDLTGIFHSSSRSGMTYYAWGKDLITRLGYDPSIVQENNNLLYAKRPGKTELVSNRDTQTPNQQAPKTIKQMNKICVMQRSCSFKLLYGLDPTDRMAGTSIAEFRINAGKKLAQTHPMHADMVIPIPESGIYPAIGYASQLGIPINFAIANKMSHKKTLFTPSLDERYAMVADKLEVIQDMVAGKDIVLIDESILSALTVRDICRKLRAMEVSKIHIRIPAPIIWNNCLAGMHPYDKSLVSNKPGIRSNQIYRELLCTMVDADSVQHMSLASFREILPHKNAPCLRCFKKRAV